MNTAKVIPIVPVDSASKREPEYVAYSYENMKRVPDFGERPGQKRLSNSIHNAIVNNQVLIAEAPTGVGKTIAYAIGAISAAREISPDGKIPVVLATATNGLQQQIVQGDLPKLEKAGLIDLEKVVIAKGRGRYFCVTAAERFVSDDENSQFDLFDATSNDRVDETKFVEEMLTEYRGGSWDGDKDSWQTKMPTTWDYVKASSETCVGRSCEHYGKCPFFRERMKMAEADVIVANHDLVISDLMMAAEEKGEPLFPFTRYIAVFDEGHNLPEKAVESGGATINIAQTLDAIGTVNAFAEQLFKVWELQKIVRDRGLSFEDFDTTFITTGLESLRRVSMELDFDEETNVYRFPKGDVGEQFKKECVNLSIEVDMLTDIFKKLADKLKSTKTEDMKPLAKLAIAEALYNSSFLLSTLKQLYNGLKKFAGEVRQVRWVSNKEGDISLSASPLEGGDVLKEILWGRGRVFPIVVSATVRDFQGYERYAQKAGVPPGYVTETLDHIFPYKECSLVRADMRYSPRWEERQKFEVELSEVLPQFIRRREATLVLFPSKSLMTKTMPAIKAQFGSMVLAQGDMAFKELIAKHKARVDEGKGSVLCGLATMAEGLDLPGQYCVHVCITQLPFAVPTSPVESEMREVLGEDNYFMQRSLPDMLTKLTQMVGRLMRRPTDRGRITVFDKRLSRNSMWGNMLLNALPPFQIRREQVGDRIKASPVKE